MVREALNRQAGLSAELHAFINTLIDWNNAPAWAVQLELKYDTFAGVVRAQWRDDVGEKSEEMTPQLSLARNLFTQPLYFYRFHAEKAAVDGVVPDNVIEAADVLSDTSIPRAVDFNGVVILEFAPGEVVSFDKIREAVYRYHNHALGTVPNTATEAQVQASDTNGLREAAMDRTGETIFTATGEGCAAAGCADERVKQGWGVYQIDPSRNPWAWRRTPRVVEAVAVAAVLARIEWEQQYGSLAVAAPAVTCTPPLVPDWAVSAIRARQVDAILGGGLQLTASNAYSQGGHRDVLVRDELGALRLYTITAFQREFEAA